MKVAILKNDKLDYNRDAPFNPSNNYPEYPFESIGQNNEVYDSVRNILLMRGLDKKNYNTKSWNPLGEIIKPGDNVLIKPNLVKHTNPVGGTDQLLTHGSVIRAVLDYVYIALKGKGHITIGDAPIQSCDFEKAIKIVGIDKILDFYKKNSVMKIDLVDFRIESGHRSKIGMMEKKKLKGDPSGYTAVDLGRDSEHFKIKEDYKKFRVTNYDKNEMLKHHNISKNEYLLPNCVLNANVIINLPKLKTHRKAGMTCALKNMIGINGSKDWLPHHRFGSLKEQGDEYLCKSSRKRLLTRLDEEMLSTRSRFYSKLLKIMYFSINSTKSIFPLKDQYVEGNWYGNDTIPRTIVDLNKIIFYADKTGVLKNEIQRKMFIVVDAIVAGEKFGPLEPTPKYCKLLAVGCSPAAIDLVCSGIMGFDHKKIPVFKYVKNAKKYKIFDDKKEIDIISDKVKSFNDIYNKLNFNFIPTDGWKGHIEYEKIKS